MKIDSTKAKKLMEKKNAKLIDVRSAIDFSKGSIPNAVNMPIRNVSQLLKIQKNIPLIFVGLSDDDKDMIQAENYALQMGFTEVYNLGSLSNWKV